MAVALIVQSTSVSRMGSKESSMISRLAGAGFMRLSESRLVGYASECMDSHSSSLSYLAAESVCVEAVSRTHGNFNQDEPGSVVL